MWSALIFWAGVVAFFAVVVWIAYEFGRTDGLEQGTLDAEDEALHDYLDEAREHDLRMMDFSQTLLEGIDSNTRATRELLKFIDAGSTPPDVKSRPPVKVYNA